MEYFPGQKQTFDDAFFQAVNRLRPPASNGAGIDLGRKIAEIASPSISPFQITLSADAAAVLSSFHRPRRLLSITSDGLPGFNPSSATFKAPAKNKGMSRVDDDGISSSIDNTDGPILGHNIGRYVVHHAFRIPTPH